MPVTCTRDRVCACDTSMRTARAVVSCEAVGGCLRWGVERRRRTQRVRAVVVCAGVLSRACAECLRCACAICARSGDRGGGGGGTRQARAGCDSGVCSSAFQDFIEPFRIFLFPYHTQMSPRGWFGGTTRQTSTGHAWYRSWEAPEGVRRTARGSQRTMEPFIKLYYFHLFSFPITHTHTQRVRSRGSVACDFPWCMTAGGE